MIIDPFDFDYSTQEIEEDVFDLEKIKAGIPSQTSQKLCEMIACDRHFGINKNMTVACMEELANRRTAGDNFDFESYIEASLAEYPSLDFDLPDFRSLIGAILKK